MSTSFHAGEMAVQQRAGEAEIAARNGRAIQGRIPAGAFGFLAERSWAIVSAADAGGALWIDLVSGGVGTLAAGDGGASLTIAGTPTVGRLAMAIGAPVGVLAIDLASRRRLRINGRIRASTPRGWVVLVEDAMPNCPKYIQRRSEVPPSADPPVAALPSWESALDGVLARCDTLFIGTSHAQHGGDASHRGGPPGFVRRDGRTLRWPDYPGNSVFQTLGNLACDPRCAVLLLDPATGIALALSGRAVVAWDQPDPEGRSGGTSRFVEFTIVDGAIARLPLAWTAPEPSPWLP